VTTRRDDVLVPLTTVGAFALGAWWIADGRLALGVVWCAIGLISVAAWSVRRRPGPTPWWARTYRFPDRRPRRARP
jgi:hypothetical protein